MKMEMNRNEFHSIITYGKMESVWQEIGSGDRVEFEFLPLCACIPVKGSGSICSRVTESMILDEQIHEIQRVYIDDLSAKCVCENMAKSSESIVYGLKGMSFRDKRESLSTKGWGFMRML